MVFQGEDTVLEEDILKKKIEFVKSWVEWAADNFKQIIESQTRTSAGTSTILTVPDNKTIFITSAWISIVSIASVGAAAGQGVIEVGGSAILGTEGWNANLNTNSTNLDFSMPIKVEAKQLITFRTNLAEIKGVGGIVGFQIDKKISP